MCFSRQSFLYDSYFLKQRQCIFYSENLNGSIYFSFKQRYWNCMIRIGARVWFSSQQCCTTHYTWMQGLHSEQISSKRNIGHWKPFSLKRQEWISNNLWPGEKKSLNLLLSCKLLFVEHDGYSYRMLSMLSWKTLGIWLENVSILSQDLAELDQVSLWLNIKKPFLCLCREPQGTRSRSL